MSDISNMFDEDNGPMETALIQKREETTIEKLNRRELDLQYNLTQVQRLKKLLSANPEFEELLNLTREIRLR